METAKTPSNNEIIVRYLLGDLPEEKQVEIEDRAFQDQQYLESIVAVEDDLIDAYVRGEISQPQRAKFEEQFFLSERRRQKVEFARALATVADEAGSKVVERPVAHVSWLEQLATFFRSLRPVTAFSLAAASLLVLAGGVWLLTESIRLRSELNRLRAEQQIKQTQQKNLEEQIAKERARGEELAEQLQTEQQRVPDKTPPQEVQKTIEPPAFVSLVLGPGISRGSSNRARLLMPEGVRTVQLKVGIDPLDVYNSFRVEIRSQQGWVVWSREKVKSRALKSAQAVFLQVPATALSSGAYELSLKGVTSEGRTEDVGFYYFDVVKK